MEFSKDQARREEERDLLDIIITRGKGYAIEELTALDVVDPVVQNAFLGLPHVHESFVKGFEVREPHICGVEEIDLRGTRSWVGRGQHDVKEDGREHRERGGERLCANTRGDFG